MNTENRWLIVGNQHRHPNLNQEKPLIEGKMKMRNEYPAQVGVLSILKDDGQHVSELFVAQPYID